MKIGFSGQSLVGLSILPVFSPNLHIVMVSLKTEILNLESGEWEQAGDYPFSNGNRYVSKDFIESHSAHQIFPQLSQKQ